ncbi:Maf family protein [Gordonia polyisoprenivorans]|uniref:Maf family protein n=1 Tax=Gordonia polyisoprenivorans TaxID=84595 RepID=UPI001AD74390|nr:Maf family protein [Gordonia polyisoprenivorans]QTI71247.1 septum formation inhibitor Maf [Gordonia polyisoprenivorans]
MNPAGSTRRHDVVLGSASPARLSVLTRAGVHPRVLVSDVDEDAILDDLTGVPPSDVVARLAMAKSDAVVATLVAERDGSESAAAQDASMPDTVVLTCDSMLLFRGALTGKPHTPDVAIAQWKRVRGQSAELLTGHHLAVLRGLDVVASASETASTTIDFADLDDAEIEAYVATGEPLEVAGGFTLDGLGGWFVDAIDGDPSSVLGIGLPTVRRLLRRVGIGVAELW